MRIHGLKFIYTECDGTIIRGKVKKTMILKVRVGSWVYKDRFIIIGKRNMINIKYVTFLPIKKKV